MVSLAQAVVIDVLNFLQIRFALLFFKLVAFFGKSFLFL